MKNLIYIILLTAIIIGCASTNTSKNKINTNDTTAQVTNDTVRIANDSLEYEIIIIEPGFNAWLVTKRPRGYYTQSTLETRNKIYVINYNNRVLQPTRFNANIYTQQINYNNFTDYGYEVNYLLFNWFEFFQERYKQNLR